MKALLVAVLLVGAVAHAEEIADRSQVTGNEQVVSVGSCNIPMVDQSSQTVSSDFPYTVCVETKHFKARVIKHEDNLWNKTSYEPIPGTERFTYALATRSNGDTREIGQSPALAVAQAMATCANLRSALGRSVVPVSNTGCGRQ